MSAPAASRTVVRTRTCPCGCQRRIAYGRVACPAGWRRLPAEHQAAVQSACRRRTASDTPVTRVEQRRARDEARRWLHEHPGGVA